MTPNTPSPFPHLDHWTLPKNYMGAQWEGWFASFRRNRDSGNLDQSNFRVAESRLSQLATPCPDCAGEGLASCPAYKEHWEYVPYECELGTCRHQCKTCNGECTTVVTVRENHFLVGWVEWIAIHKSNLSALRVAEEMAVKVDNYPILDEMDLGELEHEEVTSYWASLSLKERVQLCAQEGDSIFAARHDHCPDEVYGHLRDTLGC